MTSDSPVWVIAEAGVNHNGSVERALALVEAAAEAGADAVKFQTFRTDRLVTRDAPKAGYQAVNTGSGGGQYDMLKALELDAGAHRQLQARCAERSIEFLSTPFDEPSLEFLVDTLAVKRLKLGSGEVTNAPLLLAAARSGLPVILSTGMATLDEVERALGVMAFGAGGEAGPPSREAFARSFEDEAARAVLAERVSLLHCSTAYPTPPEEVNLRAMDTLRDTFGLAVGYSDHTLGIAVSLAAAARGATVIEKHLTLDRKLPGPDHRASLEPPELAAMVSGIRVIERSMGDGCKVPGPSERANIDIARKCLVASRAIRRGERFGHDNLTVKRAGGGRSPFDFWSLLGTPSPRDYDADEPIS